MHWDKNTFSSNLENFEILGNKQFKKKQSSKQQIFLCYFVNSNQYCKKVEKKETTITFHHLERKRDIFRYKCQPISQKFKSKYLKK